MIPFGASCEMDICKPRCFRLNMIQIAGAFGFFMFVLHSFEEWSVVMQWQKAIIRP